jgi:putative transposase
MREANLVGASRRRVGPVTTRRDKEARPAPDLVDRDFFAPGPNQLWVADITFVPTTAGFLYLAVVLDAWSRKVVGWAMANHLRAELVLDALQMAVGQRRPKDVIHHSDQGSQYTSLAFGKRCKETGVRPSMGSVGDAYDCEFTVLPGEPDPSLRLTPCPCVDLSAFRAAPAGPRRVTS